MAELTQIMEWACTVCSATNETLQFAPTEQGIIKALRCDYCGSLSNQSFFLGAVRPAKPTPVVVQ